MTIQELLMKKKCRLCINVVLVLTLILGLILPTSDVNAAGKGKSKKHAEMEAAKNAMEINNI